MSATKQLYSLTGLRFFAAISVAMFHFTHLIAYPSIVKAALTSGNAGVSFFFVLSGFVMLHVYRESFSNGFNSRRYAEFLWARFARVYPMYLVSLAIITGMTLVIFWILPSWISAWFGELPSVKTAVSSWVANLFLVQIYYPSMWNEAFWNAAAWSLSCEFFFYAAFPFIAWGISTLERRNCNMLRLILGLFIIEVLVYLAGVAFITNYPTVFPIPETAPNYDFIAYRLPVFRIWEFAIGCCLAAVLKNTAKTLAGKWLASPGGRNATLLVGISICCALVYARTLLIGSYDFQRVWTMFRWGVFDFVVFTLPFGLIIASLAAGPTFLTRVLENRFIVLLGEASYSLYILHIGTWHFVSHLQHAGIWRGSLFPALALLATVAISTLCFKYIEVPCRIKLRALLDHRFRSSCAPSIVTTAIGSQDFSSRAA